MANKKASRTPTVPIPIGTPPSVKDSPPLSTPDKACASCFNPTDAEIIELLSVEVGLFRYLLPVGLKQPAYGLSGGGNGVSSPAEGGLSSTLGIGKAGRGYGKLSSLP
nr:hypothetical protein [Tanacetum cinerariifolium]